MSRIEVNRAGDVLDKRLQIQGVCYRQRGSRKIKMEIAKLIFNWTGAIAWPIVVLTIIVMFRIPIRELLNRVGAIADRASREPFDIQLGEKLKISFKEAIQKANPKSV